MTRIDFYVLKAGAAGDRFGLTCRLVERILGKQLRVLIYCPDPAEARHLDRLLWTFRDDSFLPHGLVGETDPLLTPVLISADGEPASEDQVLINLAPRVPAFFDRFERVCEVIDQDPAARRAGRERYADYRVRGYPPEHHELA